MADPRVEALIFRIDRPHPNVALDVMRRYLLGAVGDLAATAVTQDDHRLLLAALQELSDGYMAAVEESLADRAALAGRIQLLEEQVAALQAQPEPTPTGSEPT